MGRLYIPPKRGPPVLSLGLIVIETLPEHADVIHFAPFRPPHSCVDLQRRGVSPRRRGRPRQRSRRTTHTAWCALGPTLTPSRPCARSDIRSLEAGHRARRQSWSADVPQATHTTYANPNPSLSSESESGRGACACVLAAVSPRRLSLSPHTHRHPRPSARLRRGARISGVIALSSPPRAGACACVRRVTVPGPELHIHSLDARNALIPALPPTPTSIKARDGLRAPGPGIPAHT